MKRPILPNTTKASKPQIKSLDEQQSDFTSEGAPPPGKVASALHATVAPAVSGAAPQVQTAEVSSVGTGRKKKMEQAVEDISVGAVESKEVKQALRDITRGLKDTDRGPEVDRTYKKLKH